MFDVSDIEELCVADERTTTGDQKKYYFVDEAGDPVLFNRRKQIVVGQEGCSNFFMLGLLDVAAPDALGRELAELRRQILADPYFKGVPSMQADRKKTATAFHAKDDLAEVRRDVFALLMRHELRFFAVVRDKRRIVQLVRERNRAQPSYRYHPNQLYDKCVSRLFKERLHTDDAYRIVFAKRGRADRTAAFLNALENARNNLRRSWGIEGTAPIEVVASLSVSDPSLQAADYFLWALQRLFEKKEARYWEFIWSKVSLVYDIDDVKQNRYGAYYSQRNPLTLAELEEISPGI